MPAERTKRNQDSGCASPAELASPLGIAFATNLTPVTFNDPPPLVELPAESILFPPLDDAPRPRRPGHGKRKPENHIPRPPNAFILFRSSFIKSQHVSTEVETNHSTLSKIIGLTWQNLPSEERDIWHAKAKAALEEHKRKYPHYTFRPLHGRKGAGDKRKVREVEPKDLKRCSKIAELLVRGKKGAELNAAIQEFDRHHVPEFVTRFEEPLTEQEYRRSSSEPAESSRLPTSTFTRKSRASSSQPNRRSSVVAHDKVAVANEKPAAISFQAESLSIQAKQESSFEFDSFSFSNLSTPLPTFSCDPLQPVACDASASYPQMFTADPQANDLAMPAPRRGLSIDTTFISDWASCESPMSSANSSMPATPYYMDSPPPSSDSIPCASYELDSSVIQQEIDAMNQCFVQASCTPTYETQGYDTRQEVYAACAPYSMYSQHPSPADYTYDQGIMIANGKTPLDFQDMSFSVLMNPGPFTRCTI